MREPERLIDNAAFRALAQRVPLPVARELVSRALHPLVCPPRRMNELLDRVRGHLAVCLPDLDRAAIDRHVRAFRWHYGAKFAEDCLAVNVGSVDRWLALVARYTVREGSRHFHAALDHEAGILAVGSHVGAISFGTVALIQQFYPLPLAHYRRVRICAEPDVARFPRVLANLEAVLQDIGGDLRFILTDRPSRAVAGEMGEMLASGGFVTTNLDVLAGGRSDLALPLFDGRVRVRLPALVGAAKLALRHGATVLPWRCLRERRRFRLVVDEPIGPLPCLGRAATAAHPQVRALVERLRTHLERAIVEHPEQWTYWDRLERRLVLVAAAPGEAREV